MKQQRSILARNDEYPENFDIYEGKFLLLIFSGLFFSYTYIQLLFNFNFEITKIIISGAQRQKKQTRPTTLIFRLGSWGLRGKNKTQQPQNSA